MLRCSGDIDFFMDDDNYHKAQSILVPMSSTNHENLVAKEHALNIDGVDIELHSRIHSNITDKCDTYFAQAQQQALKHPSTITINSTEVKVLPQVFNSYYILIHMLRHLASFGVSLRQLCDWCIFVSSNIKTMDTDQLKNELRQMGLEDLWNIFASFSSDVLAAPLSHTSISHKSRRYHLLWHSMKTNGNFGHNSKFYTQERRSHFVERISYTFYTLKNQIDLFWFDPHFALRRVTMTLKDTLIAPFRFLFGKKQVIYNK